MNARREFHPLQAVEIAKAFEVAGVDYLERVHPVRFRSAAEIAIERSAEPPDRL